MTLPKMILFDYGQTLMIEGNFDALAGDEAPLRDMEAPSVPHLSISSWAELHRMLEQGKIRA